MNFMSIRLLLQLRVCIELTIGVVISLVVKYKSEKAESKQSRRYMACHALVRGWIFLVGFLLVMTLIISLIMLPTVSLISLIWPKTALA